jgi:hypothetical protein
MGQITITLEGSFGARRTTVFSAQEEGHACCVAKAIAYLATAEMPEAVANDHRAARDDEEPARGFAGKGHLYAARRLADAET